MSIDFSPLTSVVSDVASSALPALVGIVAAYAAVKAAEWGYVQVMAMLGRDGWSNDNGGWVQDENGNWFDSEDD